MRQQASYLPGLRCCRIYSGPLSDSTPHLIQIIFRSYLRDPIPGGGGALRIPLPIHIPFTSYLCDPIPGGEDSEVISLSVTLNKSHPVGEPVTMAGKDGLEYTVSGDKLPDAARWVNLQEKSGSITLPPIRRDHMH